MLFQLAQINIGRLVAPVGDPRIADFVAQLDSINALAESAPGFVWRLKSDSGNATDVPYSSDPFVIVNMSVWESVETLRDFTYASQHVGVSKIARNGLRSWISRTTACGGFLPATFPPWSRAAFGWRVTSAKALRRTHSGFRSASPPRLKTRSRLRADRGYLISTSG